MRRKKFPGSVRKFVRKEKARIRRQFGRESAEAKVGVREMVASLMQKYGVARRKSKVAA